MISRFRWLLRLEGLVVLVGMVVAYSELNGSWLLFAVLFFAPDLSMIGYLKDPELGAATYNSMHTYLGPAALGAVAWWGGIPAASHIAVIWAAHIGFDRVLGYGLKSAAGFRVTHLSEEDETSEARAR